MNISSSRFDCIVGALEAWKKYGFEFLRECGGSLFPLENHCADEFGLYYYIPLIVKKTGLSIQEALWWWDLGIIVVGLCVALGALWVLSSSKVVKVLSCYALVRLGLLCWPTGSAYIIPFFPVCFFPWLFVAFQRRWHKGLWAYCFVAGVIVAFSNCMRMHAGTALGLGVMLALVLHLKNVKKLIAPSIFLLAGFALYAGWFSSLITKRNNFLEQQGIVYSSHPQSHVFWHTTYIGLGFLQNSLGVEYTDTCAAVRAQKDKPDVVYCSFEYNNILRKATFDLFKQHRHFVLVTMFAKLGVLFYYLLLFGNIGLLCAWFYRKPWYVDIPYACVLGFSALPGFLSIPIVPYLTGFIAAAVFYNLQSLGWAMQHGLMQDVRTLLRRFFF